MLVVYITTNMITPKNEGRGYRLGLAAPPGVPDGYRTVSSPRMS
jgi:hypothetical protein